MRPLQRLPQPIQPRTKKKTDTLTDGSCGEDEDDEPQADCTDDGDEPEEKDGTDTAAITSGEKTVYVRYRHSFMSRMIQSEEEVKGYYKEIKNRLLSYKGVKARMSWGFESFSSGRLQIAKMNIRGKALVVFFAIDPSELDAKYHVKDNSEKSRYSAVPSLFRVKSARSVKYAFEIIDMIMKKNNIDELDAPAFEDVNLEYRDTAALVAEGLVKAIYSSEDVDENTTLEQANVAELIKK